MLNYLKLPERKLFNKKGDELMQQIYDCILQNKLNQKYINKKTTSTVPIEYGFIFNNIDVVGNTNQSIIKKNILKMQCNSLDTHFLYDSFINPSHSALIRVNPDSSIHTLLTFYYNLTKEKIEVVAFCCSSRGGGHLFNYFINSVKCGINSCSDPLIYSREIYLGALEEAVDFYTNFGFTLKKKSNYITPMVRQLSQNASLEDEIVDEAFEDDNINIDSKTKITDIQIQKERNKKITDIIYNLRQRPLPENPRYSANVYDLTQLPEEMTRSDAESPKKKSRRRSTNKVKKVINVSTTFGKHKRSGKTFKKK